MSKAINLQNSPYAVNVESGKTYYWCSCGQSKNLPHCDGSHQGTGFEPVSFTPEQTETAYLCGCNKTKTAPFCDGSHDK